MKVKFSFINLSAAILLALFWTACGSSSSTTTSSSSGSDTGTTVGDTLVVEDLSTLPNLDLDGVDVTSANLAAPSTSKSVADGNSTAGSTSQAGCMAVNFLKPTGFAQLKQAEIFKCYMSTTQDANPDVFVIPAESYGYYIVDQGASAQGVRYVGVRVGNFTDGDSSSLKMEACSSSDNATYTKMMEAKITGNVTDKTWSGFATSHMSFGEGGPETPEGETITGEFSNSTFTINMSTAQSMLDAFDFANATSLTTTGIFGRNPNPSDSDATSATTYADGFRVNFDYAASPLLNTVSGTFGNGTTVTGIIYAQFNETVGAGQMNYSNTIAGDNNFNSSEAFSVGAADENGDIAILVTDEAADTSGIYATVSAEDLTPLAIDVPDDVNTAVAWAYDWDCTAPSGSSFTTIDASAIDYATCDALSAEVQDGSGKGSSSCFEGGGGEGGENGEISLTGTYTSTAALPCPADFASPAIAVTGSSPNLVATAGSSVLNITITGPTTCSAVLVGDGGCNTCSLSTSNGVAFTVACPRNQQVCNMTLTKN